MAQIITNNVMTPIIGSAESFGKKVSINDDTIPLPYCIAPNNAAPEPAILPALSNANAFVTAAMMPFIEKNKKQPITINHSEW